MGKTAYIMFYIINIDNYNNEKNKDNNNVLIFYNYVMSV